MNECNVFWGVWVSPKLGAAMPSSGNDAKRQGLRVNWKVVEGGQGLGERGLVKSWSGCGLSEEGGPASSPSPSILCLPVQVKLKGGRPHP